MSIELNATHDPARRSWVESANVADGDFPIQNLPFGVFRIEGRVPTGGVALGDQIVDLERVAECLDGVAAQAARAAAVPTLAALIAQPPAAVSSLRAALSDLYGAGGSDRAMAGAALVPMASADLLLPAAPRSFADFCCSIDHIRRMAEVTSRPVAPCATWLPVGYNGRASSVAPSGAPVVRPKGQYEVRPGGDIRYGPEPRLDYELEFGVWLRGGNALGEPMTVAQAEESLFGCSLVNDWSARGIQFFESMLGPHCGKSFITTVSPWIVTMEALAPFRIAARGRVGEEPAVPEHLLDGADRAAGGISVALTADLTTAEGQSARIATTDFADMFWTLAQMTAHQASSGAPLEPGDLLASGTVSGPAPEARACLAELTAGGANPVRLGNGGERVWLADGDTVTLRGRTHAPGRVSIGFGSCAGTVAAAR